MSVPLRWLDAKFPLLSRVWTNTHHWRAILLRLGVIAVLLAAICVLGYLWGQHVPQVEAFIGSLGYWGPVIFILLFIMTMPLFVPNAGFAIAAGALFGLWWGTVYIVIAGLISEMMIFTGGHIWLRGRVEKWLQKYPKMIALRSALTERPIKLMILLRLSPLPFTPICYMMSTTRVTYRDYLIGFIGYIPGNFATVYFGFVAKHVAKAAGGADDLSRGKLIIAIVGLVATIVLVTWVSRTAKKAIEQVQEKQKEAAG